MKICILLLAFMIAAPLARAQAIFDITRYGAAPNSSLPATAAFARAIAAVKAAGGGTVYVPAGHYISGPIELVSHLRLEFGPGSVVEFPAQKLPFTPGRQQGIETLTPVPLIGGHAARAAPGGWRRSGVGQWPALGATAQRPAGASADCAGRI